MTISAYTGLPGHGKSYGVIENVVVPACKDKRVVFTNIPVNADLFLDRFGIAPVYFEIDDIQKNPNWFTEVFQAGALFVVDECWRLWPAGISSNKLLDSHKAFFAEHRHMVGDDGRSTEIVLVTQDLAQIASFMRSLVESTFRVTKLSKVGASKGYRVDIFSGAVTGSNPPESRREREIFGKFKKDVYQLYKSHTKSSVGAGDESRADGRFNVLKGFKVKAFFVVMALLFLFIWYGSASLSKSFGKGERVQIEPVSASRSQVSPVAVQPAAFDLIGSAKDFFIAYNNGRFPIVNYLFRVAFDSSYADLSASQVRDLGYTIEPISQCLVLVSMGQKKYAFSCSSVQDASPNFLDGFSSVGSGSSPSVSL